MSTFHKSIRWRMQLWHGLVLLAVLIAFGVTAGWFVRAEQLRRVDQELRRRLAIIVSGGGPRGVAGPRQGAPGGGPGQDPGAAGEPGGEAGMVRGPGRGGGFRLPPGQRGLFEDSERGAYYFLIWDADGNLSASSETAPPQVPLPEPNVIPEFDLRRVRLRGVMGGEPLDERLRFGVPRVRGVLHERLVVGPGGERAVVGHSMEPENAELRRLILLFAGAGGGVLVLGLLVGGWFSGRAIRPLADISATAKKISNGNLSERISLADTESELGELAGVLNETFERLQGAIARQAQFTADASHELRTPAFVILSEAQSALKRERTAAEYREGFEVCERAAQQMRLLIESLLILARQDAGEGAISRDPCRLDGIAREVAALLKPSAERKGVTLAVDLEPVEAKGDAARLRQVVTNLVSNAVDYNRPGGAVWISGGVTGGRPWLSVRDTGVGIAAADLPHIFERFYRADQSRSTVEGHTGLGLAICQAIMSAHGGTIEVQSQPGQGSTFTIRLPG